MVTLGNMAGGDCMVEPVKPDMDLEGLMNAYSNLLLRMALIILKDLKLAEDAVQETFISYYTSFGSYRGEASVKTYLSKILINECRQRLRTAWFRRNVPTAGMDPSPGFVQICLIPSTKGSV